MTRASPDAAAETAAPPWRPSQAPVLPPAKAAIARRLLLAGARLDVASFRRRGFELSAAEAGQLAALERLPATRLVDCVASADGARRLVLALADGEVVETVAMPVGAVCVSTQVGCAVGCRFCASGLDGLRRNLSVDEILEQVVHARRLMPIDRVVLMGIGEPTHNLPAVVAAVAALAREAGIGPRRQTLSTVGSVRALAALGRAAVRPCLALSLHSPDPEVRAALLPRAARDPLPALVAAADAYGRAVGMPVQLEYTVLDGVNDRDADVAALARLLAGVRGYVNLIVWNHVEGLPFRPPPRERIVAMARRLKAAGILATIRDSAGADVDAACGQLRRGRPRSASADGGPG